MLQPPVPLPGVILESLVQVTTTFCLDYCKNILMETLLPPLPIYSPHCSQSGAFKHDHIISLFSEDPWSFPLLFSVKDKILTNVAQALQNLLPPPHYMFDIVSSFVIVFHYSDFLNFSLFLCTCFFYL